MKILRKTDYPDGRFTNTFIGYGPETEFPTLELDPQLGSKRRSYDKGNGWGHICIETTWMFIKLAMKLQRARSEYNARARTYETWNSCDSFL